MVDEHMLLWYWHVTCQTHFPDLTRLFFNGTAVCLASTVNKLALQSRLVRTITFEALKDENGLSKKAPLVNQACLVNPPRWGSSESAWKPVLFTATSLRLPKEAGAAFHELRCFSRQATSDTDSRAEFQLQQRPVEGSSRFTVAVY